VDRLLEEIHAAFPDKAIVISEYGYCACTADRPEGDGHRAIVLKTQDEVFRRKPYVGGAIFFCYNDYRTHVGDRGEGVMKQRVHGVVDLYGRQKESYELLRYDSSPIETVTISNFPKAVTFHLRTRQTLPSYTLKGYKARGIYFGPGDIPVERREITLADLQPGAEASIEMPFGSSEPIRIVLDILRPTGFSAWTTEWKR
jgi:beta-galactosidase